MSVVGLHCRNVALHKVVRTPTGEMTYTLTNGRHKFKCLPSINMDYPEIVVNFAEKTPISFLHIFVSPSVPAGKCPMKGVVHLSQQVSDPMKGVVQGFVFSIVNYISSY